LSAREALRAATAARHEALHRAAPFAALMEGRLDRAGYRRLLMRLYGFHRALETRLEACEAELVEFGIDPVRHNRTYRLRVDGMILGADAAMMAALPVAALPSPGPRGWAIGCLWVREGSTLGGRVMARKLDHLLAGEAGRTFLLGGPDDALLWRDCCRAVEECGADPARLAAMVEAACAVFDAFADWFATEPAGTMYA